MWCFPCKAALLAPILVTLACSTGGSSDAPDLGDSGGTAGVSSGGMLPSESGGLPASGGTGGGTTGGIGTGTGGESATAVDAGMDGGGPSTASDGGAPDAAPNEPRLPVLPACPDVLPTTNPLPPGVEPKARSVATGFHFVEGPVWVAEERTLFFSDMVFAEDMGTGPASTIYALREGGAVDEFLPDSGSNGLAATEDGHLLACTHDVQSLSVIDIGSAQRTSLALTFQGKHFNSTNDVTVGPGGAYYFTDPDYQLAGRPKETGMTGVYALIDGQVSLIDGTLNNPNGITVSPDASWLYVSHAGGGIKRYPVDGEGSVGGGQAFIASGSDGMAVDCAGNLYLTQSGVQVYRPDGSHLLTISVPETTTNVAFGGPERTTLYITAGTSVYALPMAIPGFPY